MPRINIASPFGISLDEAKALRSGAFELHCLTMKLTKPEPKPKIFSGSGFIKQATNGNFEFVMYSKKPFPTDELMGELFGSNENYRPGQLIPESDYFTLTCCDDKGRKWVCKQILPDKNTSKNGTIFTDRFSEMVMKGRIPKLINQNILSLEYFGDFTIPTNTVTKIEQTIGTEQSGVSTSLNILRFKHNTTEFSLAKEIGFLELTALSATKKFNANYETRITEALQFVLGQPVSWAILTKYQGKTSYVKLRGFQQKFTSNNRPPISPNIADSNAFCSMFLSYLEYVSTIKDVFFHPISAQVRSIGLARSVNRETLALVLSIAVESILQYADAKYSLSEHELEWVGKAKTYFANWEGPERITSRINGMLSMLQSPSAKSLLNELIKTGVTTTRHKQAWDELRNKLAHGGMMGSYSLQEFLDLSNTVLVLFYHLIFHIIRYQGKYTDYSVLGWPECNYPLDKDYT